MRTAGTAAFAAGPLVVAGYLLTSFVWCELRRRERDRPERRTLTNVGTAMAALVATTVAYYGLRAVAPGVSPSAIAVFAPQSVPAWESVALWTGAATVLGAVAPVWSGFRGGTGLPAAAAVAFVYLPVVLLAGAAGWFGAVVLGRRRGAPAAALAVAVVVAWLGWQLWWSDAWGVILGPESTLVVAVSSGLLGFGFWRQRDADGAAGDRGR